MEYHSTKVTGRRNNQTVEFIEDEKTSEPSLQLRQLSPKWNKILNRIIDPIELGTFVITKDYLDKYKDSDENMIKVNKWTNIIIKITM